MALHECPGPDRKRPVVPENYSCPECGAELEVWTNETKIVCPSCHKQIPRDRLQPPK